MRFTAVNVGKKMTEKLTRKMDFLVITQYPTALSMSCEKWIVPGALLLNYCTGRT